jgi:hypothetical protein
MEVELGLYYGEKIIRFGKEKALGQNNSEGL